MLKPNLLNWFKFMLLIPRIIRRIGGHESSSGTGEAFVTLNGEIQAVLVPYSKYLLMTERLRNGSGQVLFEFEPPVPEVTESNFFAYLLG